MTTRLRVSLPTLFALLLALPSAAPAQPRRPYRSPFGHAYDLDRKNALQQLMRLDGDRWHRLLSSREFREPMFNFFRCGSIAARPKSPCRA